MDERIKELRKALGLTQQKFADKLGIKQNTVAQYEMGRNPPTDTVITLICREFHVNEAWLRTGAGEMFPVQRRQDEIAAFMGGLLGDEGTDFQRRLISVLARLDVSQWQLLEQKLRECLDDEKKTDP